MVKNKTDFNFTEKFLFFFFFLEYYEIVTESLRKYSEKCVDEIKTAFDEVEELLHIENGPQRLKQYFK